MDEIKIRMATTADMGQLLQFEQRLIEAERALDGTIQQGAIRYYDRADMIRRTDIALAIAELQERPIGCGYARLENTKPHFQHRRYAYLGFMYVAPEHRGKNVNAQIIAYLQAWARDRHIAELRLEVYVDNAPAVKAYEKFGFRKNVLEMRMNID